MQCAAAQQAQAEHGQTKEAVRLLHAHKANSQDRMKVAGALAPRSAAACRATDWLKVVGSMTRMHAHAVYSRSNALMDRPRRPPRQLLALVCIPWAP